MARPFAQLPQVMEETAKDIDSGLTRIVREAARVAGRTLVQTTRVDTGTARSNWVAQINVPFQGVIAPYSPGKGLGIGETANASGAIAQQGRVISTFLASKHRSIHITNNVPYIGFLNDGSPTVGPDFMAERAVAAARAAIRNMPLLNSRGRR